MSLFAWVEARAVMRIDGATLNGSSGGANARLLRASDRVLFPAGYWQLPGQCLRLTGAGTITSAALTTGTLTLDVRMGSTVVFSGGALSQSITANATLPFWFVILLTLRAVGSSANFIGQGIIESEALSLTSVGNSLTTPATLLMPNTTPTVGNNFDATADQLFDMFGTYSSQSAGDSVTLQQLVVESVF